MRRIAAAVLSIAFLTSTAHARDEDEYREWHVISVPEDRQSATFIDAISIRRAGAALIADVVSVFRSPQKLQQLSYDRQTMTLLVDCTSKSYRFEDLTLWLGKQEQPPLLTNYATESHSAPQPGSVLDAALAVGCEEATAGEKVDDPVLWTRRTLAH